MKIILDSKFDMNDLGPLNAELTRISETVLREDVNVKPGITDDGYVTLEILEDVPVVAQPVAYQVVEVRGQYTYIADPSVLGRPVRVGDIVDVESKNGGHWSGKVSFVWGWDAYLDDHDEHPSLSVREIL